MTILSMEGETQQIAVSVPLFLRKLWKMVNDQEAEDIIGWNSSGDGFIIYDQLQFITKLLPKYFKHNNMASFIRQLNFYDFHKVAGLEKDVMQFTHSCFLKDLPETLVFIRRKCTSLRSKLTNEAKEEELSEILSGVKELKTKHSLVDSELKLLKQENAALWNEVNNLRLKHAKQTRIINKIIHFLISYMHSQNSLHKTKVTVGQRNPSNLKTGPTILEIGYHNGSGDSETIGQPNTSEEPGHSGVIACPSKELDLDNFANMQPAEHTLDQILNKVGADITKTKPNALKAENIKQLRQDASQNLQPQLIVNKKNSSKSNSSQPTLQVDFLPNCKSKPVTDVKTSVDLYGSLNKKKQLSVKNPVKYNILENTKENLGLYLDDTQGELNSLQDMLNNLNSSELADFYSLIKDAQEAEIDDFQMSEGETNVYQDIDNDMNSEGNWEENNDESLKESVMEKLTTIPVEPLVTEEYVAENLPGIEPDNLTDEYFTI